jgi:hypothetical protein
MPKDEEEEEAIFLVCLLIPLFFFLLFCHSIYFTIFFLTQYVFNKVYLFFFSISLRGRACTLLEKYLITASQCVMLGNMDHS